MFPCKTLIVVKSCHHGNTARVAEAIAGPLQATVMDPDNASSEIVGEYDLIGFGSGIYFGMLHPALRQFIRKLPTAAIRRPAFLFSTSGLPFLTLIWHLPVKRQLLSKGFEVVGEFRCAGFDTVGPLRCIGGINRGRPNDRDLSRAQEFSQSILQTVSDWHHPA